MRKTKIVRTLQPLQINDVEIIRQPIQNGMDAARTWIFPTGHTKPTRKRLRS